MCLILDGWISWIRWIWIWIRAGLLGSGPGRRGLDPSPAARWRPWRPWRGEALALVLLRHGRFASVSDFRPGRRGQHLISGENWKWNHWNHWDAWDSWNQMLQSISMISMFHLYPSHLWQPLPSLGLNSGRLGRPGSWSPSSKPCLLWHLKHGPDPLRVLETM